MKFMMSSGNAGKLLINLSLAPSLALLAACGGGGSGITAGDELAGLSAAQKSKVGIFMEADPSTSGNGSVIVNVDSVTIRNEGGATIKGLMLNQLVDLTSNEVSLPNIVMNEGQSIISKEIRLVLSNTGNTYTRADGSLCNLKTPSSQKSGLKIKLPESFTVMAGIRYSVHLSFDIDKSIVEQGNGGCLLKPVIRGEIIAYRPPVDDGSNADDDTGTVGSGDGSAGGDTGVGDGSGSTGGDTSTGGDQQPVDDIVVYQPAPDQIVETIQVDVSNQ